MATAKIPQVFNSLSNRFISMTSTTPAKSSAKGPVSFEIKSDQLDLVSLVLKTADLKMLAKGLSEQFGDHGESPGFFSHDPLLIDVSGLAHEDQTFDMGILLPLLRSYSLLPVAIRGASHALLAEAFKSGLAEAPEALRVKAAAVQPNTAVVHEVIREVVVEVPVEVQVPVAGPGTMVIDKPLRSGQKIYARGCDLVVLAMVNQGAEVVADGNIHVYAPLRGKAMAGARGNTNARIFSICLEPELISIAGIYRTSETALPDAVRGKAAQVRLTGEELDKLLIEPLSA